MTGEEQKPLADNVILIGMAGVGKSTIGILLARALGKDFIDVDILIQNGEGDRLQAILESHGGEGFLKVEERYVRGLHPRNAVISTGGSVVHSTEAMQHLKTLGTVVLIEAPLDVLKTRVHNVDTRGLVMLNAPDFDALYDLRKPMYRQWADEVVQSDGCAHDQVVDRVLNALNQTR